jgi:DnaJ-class molecular chaperone
VVRASAAQLDPYSEARERRRGMAELKQATICLLCGGTGLLLDHVGESHRCERCAGTGIIWLRIVVEEIAA